MRRIKIAVIVEIFFLLSGCASLIADSVMEDMPPYDEVEYSWAQVNNNFGRVVVYFPRLGMGEYNPIGGFGPQAGPPVYTMTINDKPCGEIVDRFFVYFDLPLGKYNIKRIEDEGVDIEVAGNDIHYLKVNRTDIKQKSLLLVETDKALEELKTVRHVYEEIYPMNLHDNFHKKCHESTIQKIYGSSIKPKSKMEQEIAASPQGILTSSQIVALFQGKTVAGKHMVRDFTFKRYFNPDGTLIDVSDDYGRRVGKWRVDLDTLCFDFSGNEKCASIENRNGKVKMFAYRFNKPNKDIAQFNRFSPGNAMQSIK